MNYIFKCLFIIIGTLIGAGFASGQEILTFFNRYGENGLYGMILSGILFGGIILITLLVVDRKNIRCYDEIILNNKILKSIFEIFLFICFCIMVAGCGAFFEQQFALPFWFGSALCALICYGIFSCRYKGLETVNILLVPFILVGIFMIGAGNYDAGAGINKEYIMQPSYTSSWIMASILYTSYNSIILVPILLNFKEYKLSLNKKIIVSLFSTAVFLAIGILMYNILNIYYPDILAVELPSVELASLLGKFQSIFYGMVIVTAIITTAVSSGYGFLEMRKSHYNIKATLLCLFAVLFSKIGFSEMVNNVFPLFGYLGLIQMVCIVIVGLRTHKNEGESNE